MADSIHFWVDFLDVATDDRAGLWHRLGLDVGKCPIAFCHYFFFLFSCNNAYTLHGHFKFADLRYIPLLQDGYRIYRLVFNATRP